MNAQDNWQDVEEEPRDLAPCKNIAHDPTKLSFKKISVKIPNYQIVKGGFFSSDYVLY